MSQDFDLFSCILFWIYPRVVEFVFTGVGECGRFKASKIAQRGKQNCEFTKKSPVLASAAEDTTCFKVLYSICIGALSMSVFVLKKK